MSHILQNASRLPYIDSSFKSPTIPPSENQKAVYDGVSNNIYFNLRYSKISKRTSKILSAPEFIKESFKRKLTVYKKVHEDNDHVYYQKVAKVSEVFHKKLDASIAYDLKEYFNPNIASIDYHSISNDELNTTNRLVSFLKVGDVIYIYPNYNADRSERRKVVVVSLRKNPAKDVSGYLLKVKSISAVDELIESGEVTKICKLS